jgi:LuxR family maltose regulon positive regulatory protein
MLQSPQPPPTETILTSLINEIASISNRIILVLDDYHLIETQPIHDALTYLLDHLPPQLHLVIATREDPHLPLARLRSRDQLTEMRAADLRFTSSEAAEFLNQTMGLDLSAEDITALETRTEGWITGLQLAAISLQGHADASRLIQSFTGSHRLVLDYLIEEVLNQQPESFQTFLLQTAILDKFNGSLCDALTGQDDGQATLEMLEHANLFIVPLDNDRNWYRYHHLFADLLRQRLRQTQPERLPMLHQKASMWQEQNGIIDEAIEHSLHGKDYVRTAYLIEKQVGEKYEHADQTILRRWLAELPEELVITNPTLCILQAWNLFASGQLDAANQSLQGAEKMLDPNADQEVVISPDKDKISDNTRMKLLGRIFAIQSFIAYHSADIPKIIQFARQALDYLPEQELEWRSGTLITLGDAYANKGQMVEAYEARSNALVIAKVSGNPYLLAIINQRLAEILRQQGKLQQVIDICEHQSKKADESGISEATVVGWLLGIWGEVLAELNDMNRALDKVKKGVELATRGRDLMHEVTSNLCLVRVLFSSGDITGAEDVIQSMEITAREYDIPLWDLLQLSAWQARIWLAQGKLELASKWVGEHELDIDGDPTYLHEMEYIVFARILIAKGRLDEADRLLQRLLETAEAGGRTTRLIEILLLQALAFQVQEDTANAISKLENALSLAEPGGFIRIFVDEGPAMGHLLYEALKRDISPEYITQLLAAFPVDELEKSDPSMKKIPRSELVEPLSDREIEVLQLISEGQTNAEIGSRLFLSVNTVKVHTRNIYAKLDVNNRIQAVSKARALGLLSTT